MEFAISGQRRVFAHGAQLMLPGRGCAVFMPR